jgi:Zn-dependent peptidase ImmA (M78 family)
VINPKRFRAPWITPEEIRATIADIQKKFPNCSKFPLDAISFAEHDLNLEFHFKPIKELGQDAFLLRDLKGIVFDNDAFSKVNNNRLNFSLAHELGHLFLHSDIYGSEQFSTIEEWLDFIDALPHTEYQKIEWQADEFAGQFLMPDDKLKNALAETLNDAKKEGYISLGEEAVFEFCCRAMAPDFKVSVQAMQRRLRRSKFWVPLKTT